MDGEQDERNYEKCECKIKPPGVAGMFVFALVGQKICRAVGGFQFAGWWEQQSR